TKSITKEVKQGDMIIVDGLTGDVIIDPTEDEVIAYQNKRERFFEDKQELQKLRDADTVSVDGVHAELAANIGTPNDLPGVIENGA
ncbi:phosphoenolpyruvate--protein phosphotransferase, partial [Staphylococcus saprophyticus]